MIRKRLFALRRIHCIGEVLSFLVVTERTITGETDLRRLLPAQRRRGQEFSVVAWLMMKRSTEI